VKIWIEVHAHFVCATPMDDQARQWMRAQCPVERYQYHGDALAVPTPDVELFENKFIDDGGQLI
jgi:hypothetical protein